MKVSFLRTIGLMVLLIYSGITANVTPQSYATLLKAFNDAYNSDMRAVDKIATMSVNFITLEGAYQYDFKTNPRLLGNISTYLGNQQLLVDFREFGPDFLRMLRKKIADLILAITPAYAPAASPVPAPQSQAPEKEVTQSQVQTAWTTLFNIRRRIIADPTVLIEQADRILDELKIVRAFYDKNKGNLGLLKGIANRGSTPQVPIDQGWLPTIAALEKDALTAKGVYFWERVENLSSIAARTRLKFKAASAQSALEWLKKAEEFYEQNQEKTEILEDILSKPELGEIRHYKTWPKAIAGMKIELNRMIKVGIADAKDAAADQEKRRAQAPQPSQPKPAPASATAAQPAPRPGNLSAHTQAIVSHAKKISELTQVAQEANELEPVLEAYTKILRESADLDIYFNNNKTALSAQELKLITEIQNATHATNLEAVRKKIVIMIKEQTIDEASFAAGKANIKAGLVYGLKLLDNATFKLRQVLQEALSIANTQSDQNTSQSLSLFKEIKTYAILIIERAKDEKTNIAKRYNGDEDEAQKVIDDINAFAATIIEECDRFIEEISGEKVVFKDYYAILKTNRDATAQEITKAYRQLAKTEHPDKHPTERLKYTDLFKPIGEAYELLSDKFRRSIYNIQYDAKQKAAGRRAGEPIRGAATPTPAPTTPAVTAAPEEPETSESAPAGAPTKPTGAEEMD